MPYALHLLVIVSIWGSLAISQGLVTGYLGVLAVHQAAAWAVGAYAAALLWQVYEAPLWLSLVPAGAAAAIVMSALTASVAGGRRDDQVVASLCLQMVVLGLINNLGGVTGGPFGIAGIGRRADAAQLGQSGSALVGALSVLAVSVMAGFWLKPRRVAREWLLLRDDQAFAESLGINIRAARLSASTLAAALAGAAGAVFAHHLTYIDPSAFGLAVSVAILAIAVIGRAPSVYGVLSATAILVLTPELLRAVGFGAEWMANLRQGLFGVVLVAAIWLWK